MPPRRLKPSNRCFNGGYNLFLSENDLILFSGDSITDGNRVKKMDCNHIMGHGYQYIISAELALKNASRMPRFANKGYSGATMEDLLAKWQADVIDNSPTVLSILAGVNDGYFGYLRGLSVEETDLKYKKSLSEAIEITQKKLGKIRIIICEPFYFPLGEQAFSDRRIPHPECEEPMENFGMEKDCSHVAFRVEATERIRFSAKETAEKYGCVFVPLYDRFSEEIQKSRAEYFLWDGTHPTVAGHKLIAEEWLKANNI